MGKIVVSEFVSLDGVVEAPGGEPNYRHTGWVAKFQDEAQIDWKMRDFLAIGFLSNCPNHNTNDRSCLPR